MEIPVIQLPPGDPRLVEAIVGQLKSKGIFDQFRKECLSDVDTKPAFQNLRQRVEGHVNKFLETKTWKNDMNKNQLRDGVRKHVNSLGILDSGIDAIITQVVNPKIKPLILPYVEDTVYAFLQIDKPKREKQDKIKEAPEEPPILFQIPEPTPDIKPSLLPMETDVISSEEDDILARESPERDHKSSPPSESNFIKEEDEDAQDGFESYLPHVVETTEDSVVSQVERLHITQDTEENKTPAPTSKPPLPLFDDQSLDSISSNSSGLTFSTLSGKGSPASKKSIDMEKSEGSPAVVQDSRSATSTPLVDEKPMDEEISQSSLESDLTKDYPKSDAKYVEPMSQYVDASATTESQSTVGGDRDDQAYASESIAMQGDESQESKGSISKVSTASEKSEGEEKVKYEKSEGEISSSSPEVSDSENKRRQPEHHRSEEKHCSDPSNKSRKSKSDHKSKRDSHSREREREREKERDGKHYKDKERKHSKPRDDHHSHRDKDKKYHRRDKDHDGDRDRPRSHHTSTRDGSGSGSGSGSSSSKGSGDREKDRSSHHSSDKSASHHSGEKSADGKSRRDKSSSKGGSKSNESEGKPEGSPSECTDNKNGNKSEVRSDKNDAKPSSKPESKSDKGSNKANSKSESKIEKTESKSNSKSEGKSEKKLDGKAHSERSDRKHDTHSSKHSSKHKKEGEKLSMDKHKTSSKDDRKRKDRDNKKEKGLENKHSKIARDSKSDKEERESKRSKDLKEDPKLKKGIKPNVKEDKQSPKESEASSDTDDQDKELSVVKSYAKQSPKENSDTDDQDKELSVVKSDAKEEEEKQRNTEGKTDQDEMPSIKSNAKGKKRKLKEVKPGSDVEGKDKRPALRTSAREKIPILDEAKDGSDSSKPDKRQTLRTQARLNKRSLKEVETDSDMDDQDEMVPIKAYAKGKKRNLKEVKNDSDLDEGQKWLPNKKASLPKKKQNKNGRTTKTSDTPDLQSLGIGDDSLVLMNEDGNLLVFTYEDEDAAAPSTSSSAPSSLSSSPQREPEVDEAQHDEISPPIREPKKRKHVEECENNNIDKRNVHDFEGFDIQTLDTRLADYLQTAKRVPDEMDIEFAEWLDESDLHMEVSESDFENKVEFREFLSYMRKLGAVVCPPAGEKEGQADSEVPQKPPLAKRRRASTSSSASSSTSHSGSPQHRRTTRARWNSSMQPKIQEPNNGRVDCTHLMEQQHPVTPAGYLLTPEDDGNRTSSRDYEVDYSQRISTYSPLSPASDSSADDGKPKTGDSNSSVDSVGERTTRTKGTTEVFKSAPTWSSDGNISV